MSKGMNRGKFPARSLFYVLGIYMVAAGMVWLGFVQYGLLTILGITIYTVLRFGYWWKRGRFGAKAHIAKAERKQERSDGSMSRFDHMTQHGKIAILKTWAGPLQPEKENVNLITAWRDGIRLIAWTPGYANYGPIWRPLNEHVLRIGRARSGKSEAQMCRVVDHVGPVIATSTRAEIYRKTSPLRPGRTLIFNPGLVDQMELKSDLQWSILTGCENMQTAARRARDLLGPIPTTGDTGSWIQKAGDTLGPILHVAAVKGFNMRAVQKMLTSDKDLERMWGRIKKWLTEDIPYGDYLVGNLEIFYTTNDRTRTSITSSMNSALAWLSVPEIAQLGDAAMPNFSIRNDLLDGEATVYMIGGEEPGVAPLMRALMSEVVFVSAKVAEERGGALSPTLLLALDEVTLTCPGAVDKWVRDMGGRGVVMDMVVQQVEQLSTVWDDNGASIIMGNSIVLLGRGMLSDRVAKLFEMQSGTRTEWRESKDAKGNLTGTTEVEVPVLSSDKFNLLGIGEAVVFGIGRVQIIKTPRLTTRRDYRRVVKRGPRRGPKLPLPDPFEPELDEEYAS